MAKNPTSAEFVPEPEPRMHQFCTFLMFVIAVTFMGTVDRYFPSMSSLTTTNVVTVETNNGE